MEVGKKIFNVILLLVTIIMSISIISCIYFSTAGKNKLPSGITTTNVTTMTDPQTGEEKTFLEANYYANLNNKGKEVVELRMNSYSGIDKQAIYSRGFQLVIENGKPTMYYYDTHLDGSFKSAKEFAWGDPMFLEMDNEMYVVKLDGVRTYRTFNLGKSIGFAFFGIFTGWGNSYERTTSEFTENYTYTDVLLYLKEMIKSSSYGTGDSLIPMLDLSTYLNLYAVDENGQISADKLSGNVTNSFSNSFFSVQCHYDRRGMEFAEQSLFNSVEGNSDFNISAIDRNVNYWQSHSIYIISENNFKVRESENGNYYYLSNETKNELNNYEDIDVIVDFNIDNLTGNSFGFDYLAFQGLKVNIIDMKIYSSRQIDFEIKYNSLENTNLQIENIKTTNVNLIISGVVS